jgi:hypothetical protein
MTPKAVPPATANFDGHPTRSLADLQLYLLAPVAQLLLFPNAHALRTFLFEHRDLFPPRYRKTGPRSFRVLTFREVELISEMVVKPYPHNRPRASRGDKAK